VAHPGYLDVYLLSSFFTRLMEKTPPNLELICKYFADFTPAQLKQFAALGGIYKEWNEKINVISRKDIDGLYEKHILHSLSIAAAFEFKSGMEVIDIGTGGGFPGIPMAIFFPETQFYLVDSIGKKLKVVESAAKVIGLSNVTTQHIRAEEIKNKKFDVALSRAVAPLKDLWTWAKPLLRRNREHLPDSADPRDDKENELPLAGGLICLKGGDLTQEIAESGCRPRIMEIYQIFKEDYFREKFLLQIQA
jgi:16S rRNA (guanine527-N7)-methyltransferase